MDCFQPLCGKCNQQIEHETFIPRTFPFVIKQEVQAEMNSLSQGNAENIPTRNSMLRNNNHDTTSGNRKCITPNNDLFENSNKSPTENPNFTDSPTEIKIEMDFLNNAMDNIEETQVVCFDKNKELDCMKPSSKLQCHECGNLFAARSSLRRHVNNINKGIKFHCEKCGKVFASTQALRMHENIHSGFKPYD